MMNLIWMMLIDKYAKETRWSRTVKFISLCLKEEDITRMNKEEAAKSTLFIRKRDKWLAIRNVYLKMSWTATFKIFGQPSICHYLRLVSDIHVNFEHWMSRISKERKIQDEKWYLRFHKVVIYVAVMVNRFIRKSSFSGAHPNSTEFRRRWVRISWVSTWILNNKVRWRADHWASN